MVGNCRRARQRNQRAAPGGQGAHTICLELKPSLGLGAEMESEQEDARSLVHSFGIHLLNTHSVSKATVGYGEGERYDELTFRRCGTLTTDTSDGQTAVRSRCFRGT